MLVAITVSVRSQTTLYWDTNGPAAGAGGTTPTGTWRSSGANQNWSTASTGTGVATSNWSGNNIAVFSAGSDSSGTFNVTVAGAPDVHSIIIQSGNITFDSSRITLTGATPSVNVASGLTATFNTKFLGSTGLVKNGTGTLVLNNTTNNYTGDTVINAGILQIGSGNGVLPNTTGVDIAAGAALNFVAGSGIQQIAFLKGAGNVNYSDYLFKVGDTSSLTFSGRLTGTGVFRYQGTGSLTLSGNSTALTGALDLGAGNLILTHNNALGKASTGNDIASGAGLQFSGGVTVTETDIAIRGTGTDGTGVLRSLSGANSFSSAVTLSSANVTIASDSGSTFTLPGTFSHGSSSLTVDGAGTTILSGALTGLGSAQLIKQGTGTLTLAGSSANTIGGNLSINNGTVNLSKVGGIDATAATLIIVGDGVGAAASANLTLLSYQQIPDSAAVTINADGRFALNNFSEKIDTIAGLGLIDLSTGGFLTVGTANGSSSLNGTITGTGTLIKEGSGTLTFNRAINFAGALTLAGGTLALNAVTLTVGTLHITGNTILDFGNSTASFLNATNFLIDAGATLTIQNWIDGVDFFSTQNWAGATPDIRGVAPMNRVTFTGFSANQTAWLSYDKQITPVPEPATYGAFFVGLAAAFTFWCRLLRA